MAFGVDPFDHDERVVVVRVSRERGVDARYPLALRYEDVGETGQAPLLFERANRIGRQFRKRLLVFLLFLAQFGRCAGREHSAPGPGGRCCQCRCRSCGRGRRHGCSRSKSPGRCGRRCGGDVVVDVRRDGILSGDGTRRLPRREGCGRRGILSPGTSRQA